MPVTILAGSSEVRPVSLRRLVQLPGSSHPSNAERRSGRRNGVTRVWVVAGAENDAVALSGHLRASGTVLRAGRGHDDA